MKLLLAIVGSVLLLCLAAFCMFGFLATLEQTNKPGLFIAFRIGYSVVGIACLAGVILLLGSVIRR